MKLSKNFELSEFVRSDTVTRKEIFNHPGVDELRAVANLVANLLQPIRELYGKRMVINSGYRSPELNEAVGGVPSSQHVKGEAADVACENPEELKNLIVSSGLAYDQIGVYKHFLHISLKLSGQNRHHIFKGEY